MIKNKVYIIILNWNGTNDTIECLLSLKKINYSDFQVILVDNASVTSNYNHLKDWCIKHFKSVLEYSQEEANNGMIDATEDKLIKENSSERLLIIRNRTNLGFAAGNNVALNYVLSRDKNSLCLLLNNDTIVNSDFLEHLVTFMNNNPKYVACTPQIRLYKNNNITWNCGGKLSEFGTRKYYYVGVDIKKVPQDGFIPITFITGCALFFRPAVTGILTEKFFFGEEDFEFSLRTKTRNQSMACIFNSIIYHKVGNSIDSISKNERKIVLNYTMRLMNLKDYYSPIKWHIIYFLYFIYSFTLIIVKNKMSFKCFFQIWGKIYYYLKRYNNINKELFEEIIYGHKTTSVLKLSSRILKK